MAILPSRIIPNPTSIFWTVVPLSVTIRTSLLTLSTITVPVRQSHSSLDELSQFWNVLKGDMSLIGTIPPTIDEVEHYDNHHFVRLRTKPGITGLWQVSGRSTTTDFEEIVKLDKEYIDKCNLWYDFKIILKTVKVVLLRAGAL